MSQTPPLGLSATCSHAAQNLLILIVILFSESVIHPGSDILDKDSTALLSRYFGFNAKTQRRASTFYHFAICSRIRVHPWLFSLFGCGCAGVGSYVVSIALVAVRTPSGSLRLGH